MKRIIPDSALLALRYRLINEAEDRAEDYSVTFDFEFVTDDDENGNAYMFKGTASASMKWEARYYETDSLYPEFDSFDFVWVDECLLINDAGEEYKCEFPEERFFNVRNKSVLDYANKKIQMLVQFMGGYNPMEELDELCDSIKPSTYISL